MKMFLAALALATAMTCGASAIPAAASTNDQAGKSAKNSDRHAAAKHHKRHAARTKTKAKVAERAHHAKRKVAKAEPERTTRRHKAAESSKSSGGGSSVIASVYWEGSRTANGEHYNPDGITAAHRSLPFGTRVRVTNPSNGRAAVVRINDRGPFISGRSIDLSRGAARAIGFGGLGRVNMEVLGR